jgi:hypothetical protein
LFCFEAVCVDFFYRIFFFFWPARPCMGSNSRLTAESVVPPIVYRGSLSFMEHSFSFLIAFWLGNEIKIVIFDFPHSFLF